MVAVNTPLTFIPELLIVTPNPNVGVPVVFKLPSKLVAVTTPVTLAPSGKLGVAPPLPVQYQVFLLLTSLEVVEVVDLE